MSDQAPTPKITRQALIEATQPIKDIQDDALYHPSIVAEYRKMHAAPNFGVQMHRRAMYFYGIAKGYSISPYCTTGEQAKLLEDAASMALVAADWLALVVVAPHNQVQYLEEMREMRAFALACSEKLIALCEESPNG